MQNPTGYIYEEQQASRGEFDLEPDIYYFKFGSKSGKFLYNDELHRFECLNQEPLKIEWINISNGSGFSIIDDDGTRYVFGSRITTASKSDCNTGGGTYGQPLTTSWKISKIINADQTDSIMFEYLIDEYAFYSGGSSTKYQLYSGPGLWPPRQDLECFNSNKLFGAVALSKIYSSLDSVVLERQSTARQDLPNAFAISKIHTYRRGGTIDHIFSFSYDYFTRNSFVGNNPSPSQNGKSLKLLSFTDYGNSEANANPLTWTFDYRPEVLPGRLSYAQDYWGFANSNTESTLVPQQLFGGNLLSGADRAPDPSKMQAGLLQKHHPSNGRQNRIYL